MLSELQEGHKRDTYTTGKMSKSGWQSSLKVLILITDWDFIYAGWLLLIVLLHVSKLPYNLCSQFQTHKLWQWQGPPRSHMKYDFYEKKKKGQPASFLPCPELQSSSGFERVVFNNNVGKTQGAHTKGCAQSSSYSIFEMDWSPTRENRNHKDSRTNTTAHWLSS